MCRNGFHNPYFVISIIKTNKNREIEKMREPTSCKKGVFTIGQPPMMNGDHAIEHPLWRNG